MNTGLATDLIATSYSVLKLITQKTHVKMIISVFVSTHVVVGLCMSRFFFFVFIYSEVVYDSSVSLVNSSLGVFIKAADSFLFCKYLCIQMSNILGTTLSCYLGVIHF